jgi:3-oxocholest-4-en-26-oyl-CoA dehydrogenase beta subunit
MSHVTIDAYEHELLAGTVREFFDRFVDNAYLNQQEHGETGYDVARWKQMSELGWIAINVPARLGGSEGGLSSAAVIARQAGWSAFASPLLSTLRVSTVLESFNDDQRIDDVLSGIGAGTPTALLAPPDKGICIEASRGDYLLSGQPAVVEWAAESDVLLALLPRGDGDTWVCARLRQSEFGGRVTPVQSMDNERSALVDVDQMRISRDDVLFDVPARRAEYSLARANLLRASSMVGGAEAVLGFTAEYALQRHQFGKPIGAFQAARHHLARMMIAVDAARLSCEEAITRASPDTDEWAIAALACFVAGRSYVEVVLTAAQLHGGIGTTVDHVLHHHFRRAKAMQLRSGKRASRLREITEAMVCRREGSLW